MLLLNNYIKTINKINNYIMKFIIHQRYIYIYLFYFFFKFYFCNTLLIKIYDILL